MRSTFLLLLISAVLAGPSLASTRRCYFITADKEHRLFPKYDERLCLQQARGQKDWTVTLELGGTASVPARTVGEFHVDLLDWTETKTEFTGVYGIREPADTLYNFYKLQVHGKRQSGEERVTGQMQVGMNLFYFASSKQP